MGVLHETGHALYEAGLPRDWRRQPVGNARGMALHESQSLLMEMQACRSDAFLAFAAPRMRAGLRQGRAGLDGRQPPPPLHARGAGLHPRRRRRGDLSAAHHAALPAGARDAGGRPRARRPAGRLERGHARAAGHRAARRRAGLPAGHPLAGRRAGATSRPTRWAPWPRPSSSPPPAGPIRACWRPSARAISRPLLGWLRTNVHGKGSIASDRRDPDRGHRRAARRRRLQGPSGKPLPVGVRGSHARPPPQLRMLRQGPAQRRARRPDLHLRVHVLRGLRPNSAGRPLPQLRRRSREASDPPGADAGQAPASTKRVRKDHAACRQVARSTAVPQSESLVALHQHPPRLAGQPCAAWLRGRHARGPRPRRRPLPAGRMAAVLHGRDRAPSRASPTARSPSASCGRSSATPSTRRPSAA